MAHEDEVYSDHYLDFFINELYEAFNDLIDELKALKSKSKELRLNKITKEKDHLIKENQKVKSEKVELDKLNNNLIKENESLKTKNNRLKT